MAKYIIEGGNPLKGEITISGNKNSVLPCIAASLLTQDEVTLKNVPNIADVLVMVEILKSLGVEANLSENQLKIKASNIQSSSLPSELVNKLRASVLLAGPILARTGEVEFSHPGGDTIGKRSIETHIDGFKQLGFSFDQDDRNYHGRKTDEISSDKEIFFDQPSVTATENILMAASFGNRKVILKNCASEPHIVDLCNLLVLMGVKIAGIGTSTLSIQGVEKLTGAEFEIGPDYIEMGTYAIAGAITKGEITILNCPLDNLEPIINPLISMGISLTSIGNGVLVKADRLVSIDRLTTNIWPGFPTDLMSVFIVLATQAQGASLLHDWMYESRMFFVDKLISMGASITIADPHRVLVYGPSKLHGRELETPDIRAGMALVLASLVASGKSTINRAELIERGYEDVVANLAKLGAKISKID